MVMGKDGKNEEEGSVTNLSLENNFADISTECSSHHPHGHFLASNPGSPFQILPKPQDKIRNGEPGFEASHFHPDDNWSIRSKHQQKLFSELKLVTDITFL